MNKFRVVFNVINGPSVSGMNVKKRSWSLDLEIYDSILLSPVLSWDVIPSCLCQHHGIIAFPSLHGYHVLTGWQSSNRQTEMSIHTFPPQWSIPCSVSFFLSALFPLRLSPKGFTWGTFWKINYSHTFLPPFSVDRSLLAFIHLFSHSVLSIWGASRFPLGPHAPPKVSAGEGNKVSEDTSLVTVRMGPSDKGRIYRPSGLWERRSLGLW